MEIMQGKASRQMSVEEFRLRTGGYSTVLIDLGTGDGRFVLDTARRNPGVFAIGVDACRENLRDAARAAPANTLFVIANACALPDALNGLAAQITVNFPWGSLRDGLLAGEAQLMDGLRSVVRPGARLEIRLNASALAEAGWDLLPAAERVRSALTWTGFAAQPVRLLDSAALRAIPTTWAKRMAFSRYPQAVAISGKGP